MKDGKIVVALMTNDLGLGGNPRMITTIHKSINKEFFETFIISLSREGDVRSQFVDKVYFISEPKEVAKKIVEMNTDILYVQRHGRNDPVHDEIARELDNIKIVSYD